MNRFLALSTACCLAGVSYGQIKSPEVLADGLIRVNKGLTAWLKTKDVAYTWREIPGGHSFMVWRRVLCEFLPLIFQTP